MRRTGQTGAVWRWGGASMGSLPRQGHPIPRLLGPTWGSAQSSFPWVSRPCPHCLLENCLTYCPYSKVGRLVSGTSMFLLRSFNNYQLIANPVSSIHVIDFFSSLIVLKQLPAMRDFTHRYALDTVVRLIRRARLNQTST